MKAYLLCLGLLVLCANARGETAIPTAEYIEAHQLVAVEGGRRINLFCIGKGEPTVLFDSGLGGDTIDWRLVQGEVAKFTRACSYDRAGYGFSDPSPRPMDVTSVVEDIHRLLSAAGIGRPIVYVGHSIAGLYGVALQGVHPEDVAAEVLLDPSFDRQTEAYQKALSPEKFAALQDSFATEVREEENCLALAEQGALRVPRSKAAKACVEVGQMPFPVDANLRRILKTRSMSPTYLKANISERKSVMRGHEAASVDDREVEATHASFGDKPLLILTHGAPARNPRMTAQEIDAFAAVRHKGHRALAALSTQGSEVTVPDARHYIHTDNPQAVVTAIRRALHLAAMQAPS